ncbi:MAG: hypothetical protein ACOX6Y_00935 [Christensenellales bacterium]
MKFNLRPDGRTLRHHFSYHWWQYVLVTVLSFFIWNLIFIQTAYRAPGERRIDIYVQTVATGEKEMQSALDDLQTKIVPEVEEINVITILPPSSQDIYANVQLVTFISAHEGDIYVLGTEDFKRFAVQGAFLSLDEAVASGQLIIHPEVDLRPGYLTVLESLPDGTQKAATQSMLFGIPLADYPETAKRLGLIRQDMFLSVTCYSDNPESTLRFISALLEEGMNTKP